MVSMSRNPSRVNASIWSAVSFMVIHCETVPELPGEGENNGRFSFARSGTRHDRGT